jgi:hypothetical protein
VKVDSFFASLDTVLTPLFFWPLGESAMQGLLAEDESRPAMPPGETAAVEAC